MTLKLNDLRVACVIGERPDERMREQTLRIDVEFELPASATGTDDLAATVDYAVLAERIRASLVASKCQLIERAAKIVYDILPTPKARVTVTKFGAIPSLASASVVYP